MNDASISCPKCKAVIPLTESLAGPLVEKARQQFEQELAAKDAAIAEREGALAKERAEIDKARLAVEAEVANRLAAERTAIAGEEAEKARRMAALELSERDRTVAELQALLQAREGKLAEAQRAEADLLKKQRELDDAKRELDLNVQKQVQQELATVREAAKREAADELTLKVREKEEQIAGMQRQIQELQRKAEQGSQQLQGDVQELELEAVLRQNFPQDVIERVGKGDFGGDVLQQVVGPGGKICGSILWEAKRTKSWNDGWLAKLRNDQRAAKADAALIVTRALPKECDGFNLIEGVWVTDPRCAMGIAIAVRQTIVAVSSARQVSEGQQTKMELVYRYLTGPDFRHRIEAIVEQFSDMHAELERERRAMTRSWAKREAQIRSVLEATAGMYGDLQGIAGRSLKEIDGLDLELLEGPVGQT